MVSEIAGTAMTQLSDSASIDASLPKRRWTAPTVKSLDMAATESGVHFFETSTASPGNQAPS